MVCSQQCTYLYQSGIGRHFLGHMTSLPTVLVLTDHLTSYHIGLNPEINQYYIKSRVLQKLRISKNQTKTKTKETNRLIKTPFFSSII